MGRRWGHCERGHARLPPDQLAAERLSQGARRDDPHPRPRAEDHRARSGDLGVASHRTPAGRYRRPTLNTIRTPAPLALVKGTRRSKTPRVPLPELAHTWTLARTRPLGAFSTARKTASNTLAERARCTGKEMLWPGVGNSTNMAGVTCSKLDLLRDRPNYLRRRRPRPAALPRVKAPWTHWGTG